MAINKRKIQKLEKILDEAERLSREITQSRGLIGKLESQTLIVHGYITRANDELTTLKSCMAVRERVRNSKSNPDTGKEKENDI